MKHCMSTIEQLPHREAKQERQLDDEHKIVKKLTEWIASQKPLDPDDAKLLEENFWKLV